jgi:hypothetical protein
MSDEWNAQCKQMMEMNATLQKGMAGMNATMDRMQQMQAKGGGKGTKGGGGGTKTGGKAKNHEKGQKPWGKGQ